MSTKKLISKENSKIKSLKMNNIELIEEISPKVFKNKISSSIKNHELIDERRNQIFESAAKLFAKKGYHETSLRDISKESKIGLGSIYDYINTKEDILSIIHQKTAEIVLSEILEKTKGVLNPLEKLRLMIEVELDTMDKYQSLVLMLYQESHILGVASLKAMLKNEEAHMQMFKKVINDGIAAGAFRNVNVNIVAHIIKMAIDCWVLKRWAFPNMSIKEMKQEIIKIVEDGLLQSE